MEEASRFSPGGVHSGRRKIQPYICVKRAAGAYLEDVDGRRFLDYHAAWGPIILGHSHPAVIERVTVALRERALIGVGTTEDEVALARKVVEHVPSVEQVLFCNSGSEATFHAVRLSRAVTGRRKVIKFQGCYNGVHDYLVGNALTNRRASEGEEHRQDAPARDSAGILPSAAEHTLVCRYNDLADVERTIGDHPNDVALIIVEPILHNSGTILPKEGFLQGLRELCDRERILLVFDEVITGFRHHIGGYQKLAGVTPDLTTMGKAIANGFPVAALGGRQELLERFTTHPRGDVQFAGTYNAHAGGVAAALATIEELEDGSVHEHIFALGDRMRRGLREMVARVGIPGTVLGYGSLFVLCFMDGPVESYEDIVRNDTDLFVRYRRELIARGVFEMPDHIGCRSHISAAHTEEDIDRSLEIAEQALRAALVAQQSERSSPG
jgi:glutamate-1-semialdehyde 2,1-aminomutase